MKDKWTWARILEFVVIILTIISFVFVFVDRTDALSIRINELEQSAAVQDQRYSQIIFMLEDLIKLHPRVP